MGLETVVWETAGCCKQFSGYENDGNKTSVHL